MIRRLAWPEAVSTPALVGAAAVWAGVALSGVWWLLGSTVAVVGAVLVGRSRSRWAGVAVVVLYGAGGVAALPAPSPQLPGGSIELLVEVQEWPRAGQWAASVRVAPRAIQINGSLETWDGPTGWLSGELERWRPGERYLVQTTMRPRAGTWSATVADFDRVESTVWAETVESARRRVDDVIQPDASQGRALLSGLLVGDTSHVDPISLSEMQRSGMSHLVAVSGSNVALVLGTLFVVSGPLAWSARRRAMMGIPAVLFFAAMIGPDPSVIRAAAMAILVLLAHAFGIVLRPWTVLGAAVAGLLLAAPELAGRLGFQLSVAATAGVMLSSRLFPDLQPRWLGSIAGASVGAQVAVAPILILSVGSIPLVAPLANLLAVPIAGAASLVGVVAVVTGLDVLAAVGGALATLVLGVAEISSPLPQLGVAETLAATVAATALVIRRLRGLLVVVVAVIALVAIAVPGRELPAGSMVALDVGQGDAILIRGTGGATVLIDGGPDPVVLAQALARWGVDRIDLLVISHGHEDHYAGLEAVVGELPVGALWVGQPNGRSAGFRDLLQEAGRWSTISVPPLGEYRLGEMLIDVVGPRRRYASPNDESLVIVIEVDGRRVLLTGDIEALAQQDIAPVPVDIIKVPHHGAATSDEAWLTAMSASVAVVSVGENQFGHPSDAMLDRLTAAGMRILRTDQEGDVVVPLDG